MTLPLRLLRSGFQSAIAALCLSLCFISLATAEEPSPKPAIDFAKQIEPVLSAKCVACHHAGNAKGGLDLTSRDGMLKGGDSGAALVVAKPDESPLYFRAISMNGEKPEMPEKGEALSKVEADALREWISAGAIWPKNLVLKEKAKADGSFWSLQPLKVAEPPVVSDAPPHWTVHPIDRFVLAKLRERGLAPSPPATPRAFIRRATYDLTGLPPTPAEVEAFVKECGPELTDAAVEKLITELLSRSAYGERWGRHWLDVVRFGESRGYERNEIITNLWPFRDYVIRSINEDKPFDQLIHEHLAGDVIGKDQPDIEIGSAFLVAGPYDDVGNQDPMAAAQIRADQMDEMIRATSEAFLGLTLGCARCHDHKFDPLLAKDYYAMYATFAGTVHGPREVASTAAREERQKQLAPLQESRAKVIAERDALQQAIAVSLKDRSDQLEKTWTRPRLSRYGTEETFEPHEAKFVRLTVEGTDAPDPKQTQYRIDELEVWTSEAPPQNVALASSGATAQGATREVKDFAEAYSPALAIDGKFGERWNAAGNNLVITLAKPTKIGRIYFSSDRNKALGEDNPITIFVGDYLVETSLDGEKWQVVASSETRIPPTQARKEARLKKLIPSPADQAKLAELQKQLGELDAAIARIPSLPVWWVGTHRGISGSQQVFIGGSPERKGEAVKPSSLHVLQSFSSAYELDDATDEGSRRVALAKWITAADHPLTPRVLANRVWQHHFGTGIVDTPSDFGYMGSRPTHPELLVWLAQQLLAGGWKLKSLHRLIMTSQAYRQSGAYREDAAREDAASRLLWRFPPRRLEAEEIRDSMLSIAGKLDRAAGGPGFRLYEYQQDNVATYVPLDVHGEATYRRAIYHHNARAARVDVLTDFDCPDPAFAEPRRASTTTPLQALTLMNHRFSLDMTRFLTERLEREAADVDARVALAFELAYARTPTDAERSASRKLIETHGLRSFCRALLNSNEFIFVN